MSKSPQAKIRELRKELKWQADANANLRALVEEEQRRCFAAEAAQADLLNTRAALKSEIRELSQKVRTMESGIADAAARIEVYEFLARLLSGAKDGSSSDVPVRPLVHEIVK